MAENRGYGHTAAVEVQDPAELPSSVPAKRNFANMSVAQAVTQTCGGTRRRNSKPSNTQEPIQAATDDSHPGPNPPPPPPSLPGTDCIHFDLERDYFCFSGNPCEITAYRGSCVSCFVHILRLGASLYSSDNRVPVCSWPVLTILHTPHTTLIGESTLPQLPVPCAAHMYTTGAGHGVLISGEHSPEQLCFVSLFPAAEDDCRSCRQTCCGR